MLYKPSRNQLHERIRILSPEYDPVHVESYLRLRHGPGSENYMTDRQFAEAVRLATDRIDQVGKDEAERFARACGMKKEANETPDHKPGNYYVTVRRGDSYLCLAGPFRDDHAMALSFVDKTRNLAIDADRTTIWDGVGTARFPYEYTEPGIFNKDLGLDKKEISADPTDEEETIDSDFSFHP